MSHEHGRALDELLAISHPDERTLALLCVLARWRLLEASGIVRLRTGQDGWRFALQEDLRGEPRRRVHEFRRQQLVASLHRSPALE